MNKKVILGVLAVGGAVAVAYSMNKGEPKTEATTGTANSIFTSYNDRILVDKSGYWMLVKDNKIFTPNGQPSLDAYFSTHPGIQPVMVDYDVWVNYADKPEYLGGSF